MHYFLSPYLFFLLEKEGVLVWDFKNHSQYILEEKHFSLLRDLAQHFPIQNESFPILQELENARLVSTTPYEADDWGWDILSKIFHMGTQDVYMPSGTTDEKILARNYLNECAQISENTPALFSEKNGLIIDLPPPSLESLDQVSLLTILKNRKTCRNFSKKYMALQDLSTLLFASFGLIHGDSWSEPNCDNLKIIGIRKSSPASGGLHSEEIYVAVYRVSDLASGIYHYRPQDHKLTLISLGDFEEEIISINYKQFYSRGLCCGFYLTSRLDKIWWKYKHSRALKPTLLDLGHVSQTFLLTVTALNLQTWITAAFEEKKVNELLKLSGIKESPFLFLGIGYGSGQSIPNEMQLQNG